MKKLLLSLGAAIMAISVVTGGSALADDDDRDNEYGYLATGFTFCPADNVAVFPATNVSRRGAWVSVSCVDGQGNQFEPLGGGDPGPVGGKLKGGEAIILAKVCEDPTAGEPGTLGGELVRCTVRGKMRFLDRIRGVLHICEGLPIEGCDLTEALLFASDD